MTFPTPRRIFPLATILLAAPAAAGAWAVSVHPAEPRPGQVLRVEISGADNPSRLRCRFNDRDYPAYPVAPGKARALVPLTARLKPQFYRLEIARTRWLLPDERKTVGVQVAPRSFTHQRLRMPKSKAGLGLRPEAESALEIIRGTLEKRSERQLWKGVFLRPTPGRRSSAYGHTRTINDAMAWDWHKGIDIAAAEGRRVLAPNAGVVVLAARFPVQGGIVILDHGQGVMSAFLHLRSFEATLGAAVPKGQPIATVGGGGFSTGAHLHWGVYVHGEPVDPEFLLDSGL